MEVQRLFQPRAEGLRQGQQDHVVVELVKALLVLGAIDSAQVGAYADTGEVGSIGLENAFEAGVDQHDLELEALTASITQLLAGGFPAGIGQ